MPTDFKSHTDIELGRLYAGMCAIATDREIPFVRVAEFASRAELVETCVALERLIENPQPGSPGLRRLRANPQAEEIRQRTLEDNREARQEAVARLEEDHQMNDVTTAEATAAAPKKAKKAAKKAAPKKAAAKKAAPKKAAKKAASNGAGRAGAIPGTAKITISAAALKENPRRKGSVQHDRFSILQKFHGKTVDDYMKKGERATLNYAVKQGHAKATGG